MGHILILVRDRGPVVYSWEIVYLQAGGSEKAILQ